MRLPLCPRERTSTGRAGMSEKCHNRTRAVQQTAYHLVGSGALILREPIGRYLSGCYDPKAAKQALLNKVDKSNVRFMKCIVSQRCSSLSRFFA
jgi:hypothetical protein